MPGRMDSSLPNRHRLMMGTSGSGKSSRIRELMRTEKPRHLIAWDPDEDYEIRHRYRSVAAFIRALKSAIASGRPFQIALTVPPTVERFEQYCRAAWAVADCRRTLTVLCEELADVSPSAGKATPAFGELVRKGRKYGVEVWAVTQSPAEISKTIYRNVGIKWAGMQEDEASVKRISQVLRVPVAEVEGLQPLEYFEKRAGADAERGTLTFSKPRTRRKKGASGL